jgi:hypothetical protein
MKYISDCFGLLTLTIEACKQKQTSQCEESGVRRGGREAMTSEKIASSLNSSQ